MLKTALVTGFAIGIGRAVAMDLAKKGFDVAFHYLHSQQEAETAAKDFFLKYFWGSIKSGMSDQVIPNQLIGATDKRSP